MKYTIISALLLTVGCASIKQEPLPTNRYIECEDIRTGHYFAFNSDDVTSLYGNVYGQGPFFVKDYKQEYMLVDYVATSFLQCSEDILISRSF